MVGLVSSQNLSSTAAVHLRLFSGEKLANPLFGNPKINEAASLVLKIGQLDAVINQKIPEQISDLEGVYASKQALTHTSDLKAQHTLNEIKKEANQLAETYRKEYLKATELQDAFRKAPNKQDFATKTTMLVTLKDIERNLSEKAKALQDKIAAETLKAINELKRLHALSEDKKMAPQLQDVYRIEEKITRAQPRN